jgi:hypothetical protein
MKKVDEKKVDEKKVDEKKLVERNIDEKSETKASAQSKTLQTNTNGVRSKLEDVVADQEHSEKATSSTAPTPKQPTKNRERNDSWDDLGDEAPGSRIRLY